MSLLEFSKRSSDYSKENELECADHFTEECRVFVPVASDVELVAPPHIVEQSVFLSCEHIEDVELL